MRCFQNITPAGFPDPTQLHRLVSSAVPPPPSLEAWMSSGSAGGEGVARRGGEDLPQSLLGQCWEGNRGARSGDSGSLTRPRETGRFCSSQDMHQGM